MNSGLFWNDSASYNAGGGGRPRPTGAGGFAITNAQFNSGDNGIATSNDGIAWAVLDAGFTDVGANFGAFPGDGKTRAWYITGEVSPSSSLLAPPSPSDNVVTVRKLSPLRAVWTFANGTRTTRWAYGGAKRGGLAKARALQTAGYATEIRSTTDAGKTWAAVFRSTGYFFLSGIDSPYTAPAASASAATVCAVANAPADTPAPGAAILCSFDGGATFQTVYNDTKTANIEMVDLRFTTPTQAWAVGGTYDGTTAAAMWWRTEDGGHTWALNQTLPNYFVTSVDCPVAAGAKCWASVIDPNTEVRFFYAAKAAPL